MAKNLIGYVPENKLLYVVPCLQGVAVPDKTPNAETVASIQELENGGGEYLSSSTAKLFASILAEDDCPCLK